MEVVSVPASGSVTAKACSRNSPAAIPGRYSSFCLSEPCLRSVPIVYIWAWAGPALLHIHDFGVRASGATVDVEADAGRVAVAAMAIFNGKAAADLLNRLVISSKLNWEDVVVLRTYRRYRRQVGTTFSQTYLD